MAEEAGSLSFRYAGLSRLPDSIAPSRGVRRLDLTGNRLTELPAPIRRMLDLESLRLDDNQLASLPPWISDLARLSELHRRKTRPALEQAFGETGLICAARATRVHRTSVRKGIPMLTPKEFRQLALDLPEVVESSHMGHPDRAPGSLDRSSDCPAVGLRLLEDQHYSRTNTFFSLDEYCFSADNGRRSIELRDRDRGVL
jgi:hypothetical protein